MIQERVGESVPVIGVAPLTLQTMLLKAIQTGVSMIALGREIIVDPDWVEKVKQGKESEIETKLKKDAQSRLVVPNSLWQMIVNRPGWFPIED